MRILNLSLMSRWENWATVLLMLLIATFAFNAVARTVLSNNGVNTNG